MNLVVTSLLALLGLVQIGTWLFKGVRAIDRYQERRIHEGRVSPGKLAELKFGGKKR